MINKKCPYCSDELIHGYIKTNGEVIAWSPDCKKKSIFTSRWHVYENEIKLGKYSFHKGGKVSAFKCNRCNKIIIDIGSEEF